MKRPMSFDKIPYRVFVGGGGFQDPKNVRVMGFYHYPVSLRNGYHSFRPCWSMR